MHAASRSLAAILLAAMATAAGWIGGFLPVIASVLAVGVAHVATGIAYGAWMLAAFLQTTSDDPHERTIWATITLAAVALALWLLAEAWNAIGAIGHALLIALPVATVVLYVTRRPHS